MNENRRESWTVEQLHDELARHLQVMNGKGYAKDTMDIRRAEVTFFIRWLSGEYEPPGPSPRRLRR